MANLCGGRVTNPLGGVAGLCAGCGGPRLTGRIGRGRTPTRSAGAGGACAGPAGDMEASTLVLGPQQRLLRLGFIGRGGGAEPGPRAAHLPLQTRCWQRKRLAAEVSPPKGGAPNRRRRDSVAQGAKCCRGCYCSAQGGQAGGSIAASAHARPCAASGGTTLA